MVTLPRITDANILWKNAHIFVTMPTEFWGLVGASGDNIFIYAGIENPF